MIKNGEMPNLITLMTRFKNAFHNLLTCKINFIYGVDTVCINICPTK